LKNKIFSLFYRFFRFSSVYVLYFSQWFLGKPKDLESIIDFGDRNLVLIYQNVPSIYKFNIPSGIQVELFNLTFPSPLTAASFKLEPEILDIWLKMGLGSVTLKTVTENKRVGNRRPRLQQVVYKGHSTLVNSVGLPGPGIEVLAENLSKFKLWNYNRPVGISIGGDSKNEYLRNSKKIMGALKEKRNYFLELNISCPNTTNGKTLADDLYDLEDTLNELRKFSNQVISIKISPDMIDQELQNIGEIVKNTPRCFINAGNTQFKTIRELGISKDLFSMTGGGISGSSIFPRMLKIVELYSGMGVKVMATGGISNESHVKSVFAKGACLVGMASALIMDPFCIPKINSKI
tara:strand:+ start:1554 stop:2600 length:1047 start_codon:yes stop_codon:yes gene_type:complete